MLRSTKEILIFPPLNIEFIDLLYGLRDFDPVITQ